MDNPLVTIITPSYNQGDFIGETIDSVMSQTYKAIQHLVIDGGSDDHTLEVLNHYKQKINYISEPDGGQAHAVNKGIQMASGEIIGWLNSDDLYFPNAIKEAVNVFRMNPAVDMVYGEADHVNIQGKYIEKYPTKPVKSKHDMADKCYICQPAVFVRRSVFDKIGNLNENLHYCMDYELWLRILDKCSVQHVQSLWAKSRMYEQNKTLSKRKEVHEEAISVLKKELDYVPINWIYGYYKHRQNASLMEFINAGALYAKLNYSHPYHWIVDMKRVTKKIFGIN